jgi:flagellar L-ring protein precursor FlgH
MIRGSACACALARAVGGAALQGALKKKAKAPESALDQYIAATLGPQDATPMRQPGSLWTPGAPLNDMGRDLRASRVHDLVTIAVFESASAVSSGTTKTQRSSSAKMSAAGILGRTPRAWNPTIDLSTDQSLSGEGTTSRHNELSTTVSARVTHVLPNGNLVVEGVRLIGVNSEQQTITLRGIVRPADLTAENSVRSDRLAMLEVKVNGKGVVGDAIRRPHWLYRILTGVLPF